MTLPLDLTTVTRNADGTPRGFVRGELLTLRPVLKPDLPALAGLLAEDPHPPKPGPWTLARLEKAFKNEHEPGLWKHRLRTYVALDGAGQVRGYVQDVDTDAPGVYRAWYWVAEAQPQRTAAGCELVALHLGLLRDWQMACNVSTRVLAGSAEQELWLAAAGFAPDAFLPGHVWHDGGMRDVQFYRWLSDSLRDQPVFSTGEPASSAEVEAVREW